MSDAHSEPISTSGSPAAKPRRAVLVVIIAVAALFLAGAAVAIIALQSDSTELKWTAVPAEGFQGADAIACPTETECWLVGGSEARSYGAVAHLVGGELEFVPLSGPARGMYCRTENDCWTVATGFVRNPPLPNVDAPYYHYDGTSWTGSDARTAGGRNVSLIFGCSNQLCTGMTELGPVVWDGDQWHELDADGAAFARHPHALYCIEVGRCTGLATTSRDRQPRRGVIRFDKGLWTDEVINRPGVRVESSCPSHDNCVIVLTDPVAPTSIVRLEEGRLIETDDGARGLPQLLEVRLFCTSMKNCVLASSDGAGVWQWNGEEWSRNTVEGMPAGGTILSISCASDQSCWAVGDQGVILRGTPA